MSRRYARWGIWHPWAAWQLLDESFDTRQAARARLAVLNKTSENYRTPYDKPGRLRSDYGWRLCRLTIQAEKL